MRRRAACLLSMAAVVATPDVADACTGSAYYKAGGVCMILEAAAVGAVVGGVAVVGVNVYETALDVDESARGARPSSARAKFDTAWGGVNAAFPLVVGVGALASVDGGSNDALGAIPLSAWPLGVAMRGAWAQDPRPGFPGWAVPIAALDGVTLAIDGWSLARGERFGAPYAVLEMLGAAPQIALGVAAGAGGARADRGAALAWTAVPTAMLAHGVYLLAAGAKEPRRWHAGWRVLPTGNGAALAGVF